ncbi:MAG: FAD-dependent oxidoreductase [Oleispira sp.]|nr:FAD-dependent oxidoreductase [Oleispira sp.]
MPLTFDYIIVGAGSAGCVLANRLSENPNIQVCLIEAGKSDNSAFIHAPAGYAATVSQGFMSWPFNTVPQLGLNNRIGFQPRGKVMGGSSSVNGMLYIRGHQQDYDDWAALGNEGWGYDQVLPYFKKSEHNERLKDDYHGQGGPLNIADLQSPSQLSETFLRACESQGYARTEDPNGASQQGCWLTQVTQKDGERCSAAKAFITPILARKNLTIYTQAHVAKVLIEEQGDAKVAVGISVYLNNQKKVATQIKAIKEVILSAGAFASPQLLLLSGIGDHQHLKEVEIDCIHHLPGVGQNLQDHLTVVPIYRAFNHNDSQSETFGISLGGAWDIVKGIFEWRQHRSGKLTTNFAEAGLFITSDHSKERADIELEFVIGIVDDHNRKMHLGHGYCVHTTLVQPKSRGSIKLENNNPFTPPLIDPNFLSHPDDLQAIISGLQKTLDIMASDPFTPYNKGLIYPIERNNRVQIERYIRDHSDTEYHPTSSCKMAPDSDPMAVVDSQLRVKGIKRLRVIDASIMPNITAGNTNAPTIMIAEKAADMIKACH